MAFGKKYNPNLYPNRLWTIRAESGLGKSTFATRMKQSIAVVDADNKFKGAVYQTGIENSFPISDNLADMRDVDKIKMILESEMNSAKDVETILVDSVTPILQRIITDIQHKDGYATISDYAVKAQAMKILADVVTMWGTDVLMVYHINPPTVNVKGKKDQRGNVIKEESLSISDLELSRLQKFMNASLEIVQDENGRRGIKVLWSQFGRSGDTLWDDVGLWKGMPERIESYMYDNLTQDEKDTISSGVFITKEDAIAWGMSQGVFNDELHAKNSFDKLNEYLKENRANKYNDKYLFQTWRKKVNEKVLEAQGE